MAANAGNFCTPFSVQLGAKRPHNRQLHLPGVHILRQRRDFIQLRQDDSLSPGAITRTSKPSARRAGTIARLTGRLEWPRHFTQQRARSSTARRSRESINWYTARHDSFADERTYLDTADN